MVNKFIWIGLIILVALIFVLLLFLSKNSIVSSKQVSYDNVLVLQSFLAKLNISNSLSNNIGIGIASYQNVVSNIKNKSELKLNNKPEILYMGAEYCPFCAAERWAMIIALSRFGTFSNLHFMTSSATDYSPSTPTFTFYNSTYDSNYISFVSVEQTTNQPSGNGYKTLQTPNTTQYNLMADYDGGGSIPFVLFANKSVLIGATYDPLSVLDNYNWSTVASNLQNASTLQAQAIIGSANLITTKICEADNNTPSSVCSQIYVKQIERLT
ncbi:MAG: DUF929 family protein [Candidatus Micrarchaeaceae archaeon]